MLKEKLALLGNAENLISVPQNLIETHLVDSDDLLAFKNSVILFSRKAKNHFLFPYVEKHIKSDFVRFDIARIPKYPLPATFNNYTKKVVINISPLGKRRVTSIEPRDMYTLLVYGHCFANLVLSPPIHSIDEEIADFISAIFLKIFAKKFGLSGAFFNLIPSLRYIISVYVYVSFFNIEQQQAYKKAIKTSKIDTSQINFELDSYDFSKIGDLIKCLDRSGTLPGLNAYTFVGTMGHNFDIMNIVLFEDYARFGSCILSSTINENSVVTPRIRFINEELYDRISKGLLASI